MLSVPGTGINKFIVGRAVEWVASVLFLSLRLGSVLTTLEHTKSGLASRILSSGGPILHKFFNTVNVTCQNTIIK
uniref:Uncharacterized protein n=1 Tax=Arundo donax TaxID=35708 RepID=A0A0A8ZZ35_ARUDO